MQKIPEWVCGNIYIRPNILPKKGDKVEGHKHHFDHTTIVRHGSVNVKATFPDGRVLEQQFSADDYLRSHFLVKAEVEHEITALEDNTDFWCVYSHRDPQGRVTQTFTGFYDGYC